MNITAFNNSIVLLSRLFDCKKPTVPIITWKSEKPALTPSHVSSPLKRITPEEAGIPSETIAAFLRDIKNDISLNMHTILFVKNGCVIAEAEFGEYDMDIPKYVFSASKSVTALAIGMLIDEGRLSADEKLIDIFAEKLNPISKLKLRDNCGNASHYEKLCCVQRARLNDGDKLAGNLHQLIDKRKYQQGLQL